MGIVHSQVTAAANPCLKPALTAEQRHSLLQELYPALQTDDTEVDEPEKQKKNGTVVRQYIKKDN